ncbi:MAG: aldehyde dehydrogenase family protein [Sulfuritalea sp.]|nr:aldehyde dehydrogenase family protein [Sulfuritalea sp.]
MKCAGWPGKLPAFWDDAVRIANGTVYGLAGGVWSATAEHAEQVARRLRTGQVEINGGPFNKEVVIALGATWNNLFDEMPVHGPFANIIVLRRSVVVSQEVLDAFGEFLHANNRAGRGASAVAFVVAPDVEGRSLMLPMFAATYAAAGRLFAAFETEAEADVWVRARLKENPARPQVPTDAN